MTFTRQQLKTGFCGHLYSGRNFVGGVYLIDGRAYVMHVEDGQVISCEEKDRRAFRKAGRSSLSASRSVQNWELA